MWTSVKLTPILKAMNTQQPLAKATTKISVSVYPALLERFDTSLRQIIKRDAFLNQLLSQEVPVLRAELHGKRNSDAARKHIGRELRKMKPVTINVVLDKETADELNLVVDETNLVRDSFVNFLLYCLQPMPGFYRWFELPEFCSPSEFKEWLQPTPVSPMQTIHEIFSDPFYYLRAAVTERCSTGLYALELPPRMHGLACYLPDESVPATGAHKRMLKNSELLLKELDALDAAAFASVAGAQE
ncbi:MAG: hypothetical protein K0S79_171 [Nitrospira sp.]|jgi:hypothetical protein|nr:hypothetical protein [Nitrospira sp.]